ncbi:hypothetical protein ROZALSC1DRAFT_29884 [Rozella allomycis CSF55]|uniref:Signal recognition particle subunit SRP72 n=1 Tax=Rozella allomycis (strain CSF55) TaxID=988480 RepID=A0A075AZW3_ROZAC|nr:hypothetical protein O9G_001855 [Rozella allomycis CSF55]RKP18436.1 hypothetical protein ROZALSC1DRAFT_29884 [Rozella allomycis CSF55]|eukprot:EPZ34242.1 hypothetical protein O9G_001855 [Rozella allomycis CSF55]
MTTMEQLISATQSSLDDISSHENILSYYLVLTEHPDRLELKETKAVALILLQKFEEAEKLTDQEFLKAYCFYREGRLKEAMAILKSEAESNVFLKAQIFYQEGQWRKCLDCYQNLIALMASKLDHSELLTNVSAVNGDLPINFNSFEILYNQSLHLALNGQYHDALDQVNQSISILKSMAANEAEISKDLGLLLAHKGFVLLKLKQFKKANECFQRIETSDNTTSCIASFNRSLLSSKANLKGFKSALLYNESLIDALTEGLDNEKLSNLSQSDQLILRAAADPLNSLDILKESNDLEAIFYSIQLKFLKGQSIEDELKKLPEEILHSPGFVSFQVSHLKSEIPLINALNYWRQNNEKSNASICATLEYYLADYYLKSSEHLKAKNLLEKLKLNSNLDASMKKIVELNLLQFSPSSESNLSRVSHGFSNDELKRLEEFNVFSETSRVQALKKKRKNKLPKNIDPLNKPDPERWLPKWQRSSNKKKGKSKKVNGGAQGAIDENKKPEVTPLKVPVNKQSKKKNNKKKR